MHSVAPILFGQWEHGQRLTLDELRATGNKPRVHPNGFIQLDMDTCPELSRRRLHIWGHPEVPHIQSGFFHDHIFGFVSVAVAGALKNIRKKLVPNGKGFELHEACPAEGDSSAIRPTGQFFDVIEDGVEIISANDPSLPKTYSMKAREFHETEEMGLAATVIEKDGPTLAQNPASSILPRVMVPVGSVLDQAFSRHTALQEARLWEIIEEVLKKQPC